MFSNQNQTPEEKLRWLIRQQENLSILNQKIQTRTAQYNKGKTIEKLGNLTTLMTQANAMCDQVFDKHRDTLVSMQDDDKDKDKENDTRLNVNSLDAISAYNTARRSYESHLKVIKALPNQEKDSVKRVELANLVKQLLPTRPGSKRAPVQQDASKSKASTGSRVSPGEQKASAWPPRPNPFG